MIELINETAEFLKSKDIHSIDVAIVLGTGLGGMIEHINPICTIDYSKIPNFPVSTVESHSGKLVCGTLNGKKVLVFAGRFHYYEGYDFKQITFPIRVLKAIGTKYLLLSNAAGTMNLNFEKGGLMLIDDHINLLSDNPLRGKNYNELGPRFPDMSAPYSPKINSIFEEKAKALNINLHKGVYVAVSGPNLETRAEYRFLRTIGADVVGMSTVPEVIVANHAGIPCAAVSVLTDECDPDNLKPAVLADILDAAKKAEVKMIELFSAVVEAL